MDCIVCKKHLDNVFDENENGNQPIGGTEFVTHGHYGSMVTDHMDSTHYIVNICDPCLVQALEANRAKKVSPCWKRER